ncbi:hypothetical protein Dimus_010290 [Dionaea muscipula]
MCMMIGDGVLTPTISGPQLDRSCSGDYRADYYDSLPAFKRSSLLTRRVAWTYNSCSEVRCSYTHTIPFDIIVDFDHMRPVTHWLAVKGAARIIDRVFSSLKI